MKEVVLLLGSNLGDSKQNVLSAISILENRVGKLVKKSKIKETLPVEFDSPNFFCNIAVIFETQHSPMSLLNELKKVEREMGRECDSSVYGEYRDRVIDIDIVSYDGMVYSCKKLTIPHDRHMYKREFSRELLKEIDCLR